MTTIVASFIALSLAVAAMAVGVIFGRGPIRGSCGGVAGGGCTACTSRCERLAAKDQIDEAIREKNAC